MLATLITFPSALALSAAGAWQASRLFMPREATVADGLLAFRISTTALLFVIAASLLEQIWPWWLWVCAVYAVMLCVMAVLPLNLLYAETRRRIRGQGALVATVIVYTALMVAFYASGSMLPSSPPGSPATLWQRVVRGSVRRVAFCGITISATLAGVGAASCVHDTWLDSHAPISSNALAQAQARVDAIDAQLHEIDGSAVASGTWGREPSRSRQANEQVLGLQTLRGLAERDCQALKSRAAYIRSRRSLWGRVQQAWGFFFSIYCVYRIGFAVYTTVSFALATRGPPAEGTVTSQTVDPVSRLLAIMAHGGASIDRDIWAGRISFLLSGGVVVGCLSGIARIFARVAQSAMLSGSSLFMSSNLALVSCGVSSAYFVSVALMLRKEGAELLEARGFTALFDQWQQGVFLVAVVAILAIRVVIADEVRRDEDELDAFTHGWNRDTRGMSHVEKLV